MPELPEVETVRLQLRSKVLGKKIRRITVYHPKTILHAADFVQVMTGQVFADIERIGKLMIFTLRQQHDIFMLAHLRMTGQFFYADTQGGLIGGGHTQGNERYDIWPHRHTRVSFLFSDKSHLYFNDQRLFGYLKLVNGAELAETKAKFGPEPRVSGFDFTAFAKSAGGKKSPIKAFLLDQANVAGLGNIYVDEVLFAVGMLPTRPAASLTAQEIRTVIQTAAEIMEKSISYGGTTFRDFTAADGRRGNYYQHLQVFDRQGEACVRCGGKIEKIRCAGRGTYVCFRCQK